MMSSRIIKDGIRQTLAEQPVRDPLDFWRQTKCPVPQRFVNRHSFENKMHCFKVTNIILTSIISKTTTTTTSDQRPAHILLQTSLQLSFFLTVLDTDVYQRPFCGSSDENIRYWDDFVILWIYWHNSFVTREILTALLSLIARQFFIKKLGISPCAYFAVVAPRFSRNS